MRDAMDTKMLCEKLDELPEAPIIKKSRSLFGEDSCFGSGLAGSRGGDQQSQQAAEKKIRDEDEGADHPHGGQHHQGGFLELGGGGSRALQNFLPHLPKKSADFVEPRFHKLSPDKVGA